MSIFTASALIISPAFARQPHHPLISWDSKVKFGSVAADSSATGYPASNLANPSTLLRWQSASTAEQLVTISNIEGQSDHVAIARHNLGSTGALVSVEGITAEPGAVWEELLDPVLLGDDAPHIFRFAKDSYIGLRLRIVPDGTAPRCAVLYCGELLALMPGLSPGYVPLTQAEQIREFNGTSESGEYLGSIIMGAGLRSTAEVPEIDPDYYDQKLAPFIRAANRKQPFFFAWSPTKHPGQVAYAWLASAASAPVIRGTGQRSLSLDMAGLSI